jgi:hypothetical protein
MSAADGLRFLTTGVLSTARETFFSGICLLNSGRKALRLARKANFSARKLVQLCAQGFLLRGQSSELCAQGFDGCAQRKKLRVAR